MAAEGPLVVISGVAHAGLWLCRVCIDGDARIFTLKGPDDGASEPPFRALIDGGPDFSDSGVKYEAATDQVVFTTGRPLSIARALIASKLATELGLRQPTDLGAKPAKR